MKLLAAKLYDPAVAVVKNTTAALAMTALDTVNLRLAVTVPAHGMLRIRLMSVIHGAATYPSILLGAMNGATVIGRVAPVQSLGNTAVATALVNVEADFIVTGLAPGAMNVDAAYGVETLVAATGLKYGGPNNAVANDAFGAFVFEIWDPAEAIVDANGRVDVGRVLGTAQTARDLGAQLDATVSSRSTYAGGDTAGTTTLLGRLSAARALLLDNLDALVSSRSTYAGGVVAGVTDKAGFSLSATGLDPVLDAASSIETGLGLRGWYRLVAAVLFGKTSGMETSTGVFRNAVADSKNRVTASQDGDGNRSVVITDVS
jgi:hypothetical protein